MRPVADAKCIDDAQKGRGDGRVALFLARSRHRLWAAVAIAVALSPLPSAPADAQETFAKDKPLRIGVLALGPRYVPSWHCGETDYHPGAPDPSNDTKPYYVEGLLDELKKLNYVEEKPENAGKPGRHFVLVIRTGTLEQIGDYAREFASGGVDIIVGIATEAVKVAQQATRGHPMPILMTGVSDPVKYGFVQSLAQPGGMITGVSHQVVQGSGKRVELFKQMLPGLKHLLTMHQAHYAPSEESMAEIRDAATRLKIEIVDRNVTTRQDIQDLMAGIHPDGEEGIMIVPDSDVIANLDLVIETSLAQHVATFGVFDYMAVWGAVAANGPSAYQAGTRVAWYLDRISKGAKPGDLPVEPVDPSFVINLKAARCLGISVPLEVLGQADQVIK
jgi:putative tryptophan/tyrosine transport system substrate-binding protein